MKLAKLLVSGLTIMVLFAAGVLHFWVNNLVNKPVPEMPSSTHIGEANQAYFAYGSNMPTRYLYNVRGVLPSRSESGFIEDYDVFFLAPGSNWLEPAFSYLMSAVGKKAYGVLHFISKSDLKRIQQSEGSIYKWKSLPVTLTNGSIVEAQTLIRLSSGEMGVPSKRYLQLLVEGAAEHDLPKAYLTELKDTPFTYYPALSELMGELLQLVIMNQSGKCEMIVLC